MKQHNHILSITNPCHENWENMTPVQQGRFCQACSKTVIDFSEMGDDAIIRIMQENKGKLCGRFYDDQLNRMLEPTPEVKQAPFYYNAAASLLLLAGVETADAHTSMPGMQTAFTEPAENIGNRDPLKRERFSPPADCVDSNNIFIAVKNKKGIGIECRIMIYHSKGAEYEHTDSMGNFKINIPDSLLQDKIRFAIRPYGGYKYTEFTVLKKDIPLRKEIILKRKKKMKRRAVYGSVAYF